MPYSVSSSFNALRQERAPRGLQRKFLIGTSDYTDHVVTWPVIRTAADDPRPPSANVVLANHDGAFTSFKDSPIAMRQQFQVQIGFNGEMITVTQGRASTLSFTDSKLTIRITDKLDQLGQRVVGSTAAPIDFTGSSYLLSDIVYTVVTCYGGFSNVRSTSNPDIDWTSYADWSGVFSANNVLVRGLFEGVTALEVLRKAARISASAIFLKQNKLFFKRYTIADSNQLSLNPDTMIDGAALSLNDADTINRFHTMAGYVPASRYWTIDAAAANTPSVNSFGLHEDQEKDSALWYVDSGSAIDLAQRKVSVYGVPPKTVKTSTSLFGILNLCGEMISVTDPSVSLVGDTFRITNVEVDLNKLSVGIDGDAMTVFGGFILNTSSLNGSDVLI